MTLTAADVGGFAVTSSLARFIGLALANASHIEMIARSLGLSALAAALVMSPEEVVAQSRRTPVGTLRDVGPALSACWRPPPATQNYEVAVRFALKRDGHILGRPRITFAHFNGKANEQRDIVRSILLTLVECTPLDLSAGLGGALAGRMMVLSFTPLERRL